MTVLKHSADFLVNFHAAIISSITKLQNAVNKPKSWFSAPLLVGAARNSFSEIMDVLNVIMETVTLVHSKGTTDLEKDFLSRVWNV